MSEPYCRTCYDLPYYNEAKKDYIKCPRCGGAVMRERRENDLRAELEHEKRLLESLKLQKGG